MNEILEYGLLCSPAFIGLMFGAFYYPYMGKKGKSLAQKSREAALVGGLICLIGYTLLAVFDLGFLQDTFEARMAIIIKVTIFIMFGTGFIAFVSMNKEKI